MTRGKPSIDVVVPSEVRQILDELADERTREGNKNRVYASDIAREAIEEYLQRRGYQVKVKVDRGGYRG